MIESFVDLTYRGLSLGRRIKLAQVRPGSGYLELAAPMPVGTHIAIATDEGVAIDATVTWVYEQVTGTDRTPGMIVAPALTDEAVTAWWRARVALPDEEPPKPRSRTRPVTLRQRSQTLQTPPPDAAVASSPSIVADLQARVAAAAGVTPAVAPPPAEPPVIGERPTVAMPALTQAQLQELARSPDGDSDMRSTDEHIVIDDGHQTIMMEAIDPTSLGIEGEAGDTLVPPTTSLTSRGDTTLVTEDTLSDEPGDAAEPDDHEPHDTEPPANVGSDAPAASKGGRKRRRRR